MQDPLVDQVRQIGPVPKQAALAYRAARELLLETVNDALARNTRIRELIGGNPLELMYANHENHHRFMSNVFHLGLYELLVKTLPWVYRTYHAHGFHYDYFVSEIDAWMLAVTARLDSDSARAIFPVYRWLSDTHAEIVARSQTPEVSECDIPDAWRPIQHQLTDLLLEADSDSCLEVLRSTDASIADLYLHGLQPAMYEVGLRWERGEISVAEEAVATATARRVMALLYRTLPIGQPAKGVAVVTAAPGEFHEIGARIFSDLLELDGWRVHFAGANTPLEALLSLVRAVRPQILGISVTVPFNIERAQQMVAAVRDDNRLNAIRVLIGGQAFRALEDAWRSTGADGFAADAVDGVALARKFWLEGQVP